MLDQLINATTLYPLAVLLFVGSAEIGLMIGRRFRGKSIRTEDMGILTGSALGLLALLLAFALSHALSRFETRRDLAVEEAHAIANTANLALMLPEQAQASIRNILHDYAAVRAGLGHPYDPLKLERDGAKSKELLGGLWRKAVAVSEPQSLPANRFVNALTEMTSIQERRLTAHRYHVPDAAFVMLLSVAVVALGFMGYQAGLVGTGLRAPNMIMAAVVAVVTVLVVDLDQPARGLIQVPIDSLVEVANEIQP
jgi:hypothetical protein